MEGLKDLESTYLMNEMSKPIFTILEGGSDDPFKSVELNRDSRKYIHVRINNIIKTYDNNG